MARRPVAAAVVLGLLGLTATVRAAARDDSPASVASPSPEARATPAPDPPRLNLGAYGTGPHTAAAPTPPGPLPRFESTVEVHDQGPRDLNDTMAVWWDHFHISTGSVYGKGIVTRQTVDLVPIVEWLAKKIKEKEKK